MVNAPEQLKLLYELNRRLGAFTDLDELLGFATQRVRTLFDAHGCALLLLDKSGRELYFPLASQSNAREESGEKLADIRFPADRGVAGWVLSNDESACIPDVQNDPRFYRGVDDETGNVTRSLLCAPLRVASRNVGVIQVMNLEPEQCTEENLQFLEAVANDIAVAHEKALLYARLKDEADTLRLLGVIAGVGVAVLGLAVSLAVVYGHMARVLPMARLVTEPRFWMGGLITGVGFAVVAFARGWIGGKKPGLH